MCFVSIVSRQLLCHANQLLNMTCINNWRGLEVGVNFDSPICITKVTWLTLFLLHHCNRDILHHSVTFFTIQWHFVPFGDILHHSVTFCTTPWHFAPLRDISHSFEAGIADAMASYKWMRNTLTLKITPFNIDNCCALFEICTYTWC